MKKIVKYSKFAVVAMLLLIVSTGVRFLSGEQKKKQEFSNEPLSLFDVEQAHADFPHGSDADAGDGSGDSDSDGCFVKGTLVAMADGSTKPVEEITIGDRTKGGEVKAVMQYKVHPSDMFEYGGVLVAGSHAVLEDGVWKRISDSVKAKKIETNVQRVYIFNCTQHRIYINGFVFGDNVELDGNHPVETKYFTDAIIARNELEGRLQKTTSQIAIKTYF